MEYSYNNRSFFRNIFIIVCFDLIFLLVLTHLNLNIQPLILYNNWGTFFICTTFLFIPEIKNKYKSHLLRYKFKNNIGKFILTSVIAPASLQYILEVTRLIPTLHNDSVVALGSRQSVEDFGFLTLSSFIFKGFFPGFNEEFIFRFLTYLLLECILLAVNYFFKYKVIESKNVQIILLIIWFIGNSMFFAYVHGPSLTNSYLYFIPGLLYSALFFKYGLVSDTFAHMSFNYFGPLTHKLAELSFNLLK